MHTFMYITMIKLKHSGLFVSHLFSEWFAMIEMEIEVQIEILKSQLASKTSFKMHTHTHTQAKYKANKIR